LRKIAAATIPIRARNLGDKRSVRVN